MMVNDHSISAYLTLLAAIATLAACLGDDDRHGILPLDQGILDGTVGDGDLDAEPDDPRLDAQETEDHGSSTQDTPTPDLSADLPSDLIDDIGEDTPADINESTDASVIYDTSDETTIRGAMTLPHTATVEGQGTTRIGEISISNGVGHLARDGDIAALVYIVQDWPEFSYTLHHVLAPTNDELNVLYFYCGNAHQTSFDYVWHESYDTAMDWEVAQGSCSAQLEAVRAEVKLSRLNRLPRQSELVSGFAVDGENVTINNESGHLAVNGRLFDVYPFETVDCTTECSADPADGWWELHSILQDTTSGETCFGIFYLAVSFTDSVVLSHGFCMDSLTPLPGVSLEAGWTAPTSRKDSMAGVPSGPRHPDLGYVLRPRPEW